MAGHVLSWGQPHAPQGGLATPLVSTHCSPVTPPRNVTARNASGTATVPQGATWTPLRTGGQERSSGGPSPPDSPSCSQSRPSASRPPVTHARIGGWLGLRGHEGGPGWPPSSPSWGGSLAPPFFVFSLQSKLMGLTVAIDASSFDALHVPRAWDGQQVGQIHCTDEKTEARRGPSSCTQWAEGSTPIV